MRTVEGLRLFHRLILVLSVQELFSWKYLIQELSVGDHWAFGCQVLHIISVGADQVSCGWGYGGTGWQGDVLLWLTDKVPSREFRRCGGLKIIDFISIPGLGHWLEIKNMLMNKSTLITTWLASYLQIWVTLQCLDKSWWHVAPYSLGPGPQGS